MNPKYDSTNLTLNDYDYSEWYKKKKQMVQQYKSDIEEADDLPPLEENY